MQFASIHIYTFGKSSQYLSANQLKATEQFCKVFAPDSPID